MLNLSEEYESIFHKTAAIRRRQYWSPGADLNCRPHPYQGCALPTELPGQNSRLTHGGHSFCMHPPIMERVMGIEPTQSAWKAEVLPLNYTRIITDAPAQRATGPPRPTRRSPALARLFRTAFRFSSSPTWPRRDIKLWWRGEDYSMPSAFRPPGRRALRDVLRRYAPSSNLFAVLILPDLAAEGHITMVEGGGFEPPKAEPSDLQSDPFDRSGTPPKKRRYSLVRHGRCQLGISIKAPATVIIGGARHDSIVSFDGAQWSISSTHRRYRIEFPFLTTRKLV